MRTVALPIALIVAAGCSSVPSVTPAPAVPPRDAAPLAASAPSQGTPDAAFREKAPLPGPEVPFAPPKIEEARLANGVRVLVVERHELPIVAVDIAMSRGADQDRVAVGAFAGAMLVAGTKTRSALQVSDELSGLGAQYGAWVGMDGAEVQAKSLAPKLGAVLTVLADLVRNPAFDAKEIERERSRRLTALAQENDQPARLLSKAILSTLYPAGHPYASTLLGDEASLTRLTRADLQRFHAQAFVPSRTTVAFAGDITKAQAIAEAERVFGDWKAPAKKPTEPAAPPPKAADAPRVVLVDMPGATQSSVAVGVVGVPRTSPDHDAITVMNTILGGQFSSRINLNLRERHAYTYGVRSSFDARHGAGPFTAGGAIFREATAPALKELLAEIARMRTELVGEEELESAKQNLEKQLPARFESTSATASALVDLSVYGLPLDEYATYPARIRKVTREDVKRVAEKYLTEGNLQIFVVGDATAVKGPLAELGLGPVLEKKAAAKKPAAADKKPAAATKP